ncbi:fibronectin type III domain-containing protein [Microbulbifer harenosus]|uniref:Fibronectin type-III domain-containing protein n=1 Tax=Microbulbifer harenosus TaxID=2576840 RepID=A0ABY2UPP3_9GAMM|nr:MULTISPECIES: fibronectin type III domain-containing protein [Microbulbifer]QIL90367.1 hypothetical protein GNX18_11835 [Microbulbifer sp. SH-1]TLM78207.1 hypothetical protein FDY93_07210 [Microbulbifer harenosus]
MKPLPWAKSALALCIMGTLTACGGGGTDANNEGDVVTTPPPVSSSSSGGSSSSSSSSGGGSTGPILSENFGDGLFVNFDEADTEFFFSQEYKALSASNSNDAFPSFYYPTCCFFLNDTPTDGPAVNLAQMGIVSDNGNPALLLDTGRFTAGQTRPEKDAKDPKKDTTSSSDLATWGELDLGRPYRISFCVKEAVSGGRNMMVFVDNNTSNAGNSLWTGNNSRIFQAPVSQLEAGKRVEINVPGSPRMGGEVISDWASVDELVGEGTSFLQFRVEGGNTVIIDDLLVEYQDENGQAALPACNVFTPATAPDAPEAPTVLTGDAQLGVSWGSIVGAATYDLAYSTSDDITGATLVEGLTETSTTLTGLTNGTDYYVWVRATNNVGDSDWSTSASATPVEPLGCKLTTTSDIGADVAWSVWDGCVSPDTSGALILNAASAGQLSYPDGNVLFASNKNGTSTLNTTADAGARSKGDLTGIFAEQYPQHFTLIARVDVSKSTDRGIEVETVFASPSDSRVKLLLRPNDGTPKDGGKGRIQLERFLNGVAGDSSTGETAQADVRMTLADGEKQRYHIYHVSYTVEDPAVAGANNITAVIYRDGENITDLFTPSDDGVVDAAIKGTGRAGGGGANRIRIGEDSSSGHFAEVDWMLWSADPLVAAMSPAELKGKLPATIGELGAYAGSGDGSSNVILSESFAATDGDGSSSNFFTTAYKSISVDSTTEVPFYAVSGGGSNMLIASGALSLTNARFTIGDKSPETPTASTDTEAALDGVLDLSQPYRIRFDVLANSTPSETGSKKCQIQVDNNTTGAANSIWQESASRIYSVEADSIAVGTVTVESSVGTDHSSLLFRCENGAGPITIDNLVIERQ